MFYEEVPGHPGVVTASVARAAAPARALASVLDADERARAARFRFPADADRHRVAHVLLRLVLGRHVDEPPERLVFLRRPCAGCGGPHGKPYLRGHDAHFSLSHAGDRVLVAVAPVPVGVDVEAVPEPGLVRDLASALHPRERAELEALPDAARPAAFARCWTRKEAALKAWGAGLSRGAAEPYVSAADRPAPVPSLRLADLPPLDGHAAALALLTP
ncbi:4'-phosphopantetheinyl transferase family protein [Streptomyces bikiniensis]|uniref:4'-phosphopantetheinyl transferase family protein n=1 Tax=Streptomyces bikiniensis TaxID=1896 RepID=UPI0009967A59|nr:4'-phosphopantetheinyl transferase superfamily protein [Streptomyces bikiniensis]